MGGYVNDFDTSTAQHWCGDEAEGRPAWADQPITIPLAEWTGLLLGNADLRARMDALAVKWAASNEEVRHLKNEMARLQGEMGELESKNHALAAALADFGVEGGE